MKKSLNSGILKSGIAKIGIAVLALSLNLFAACEIGLGSAVDTEVPQIDFADTTIASGAVVRDSFAVFGTFDDDGTINSISATLTNLETGYTVDKGGDINLDEKSWIIVFDPKEDAIPDATYELCVVIKDSVDHESKISRSIIIDNTAPLVVLSRPSTKKGAQNFDSYGQSFTLEGKAADDNDVSLIEVAVYDNPDCTGSPLKTIELPNVPLTIESDVATYAANTVNDYSVIYGHVDTSGFVIRDGTDATRYCKVIVYDGAQRYPADGSDQTAADKKGNSVNYYYLNSDLAELFTAGYKITELYHILNGTYNGTTSRSIGTSNVISTLQNTQKQTNIGQFKLNPENSPHFVVSSRNTMNYTAGEVIEDHAMTNGNSFLEVEITPGLDGHLIKEETIGVYLLRCRLKTAAEAAATGPGIVYLNAAGNPVEDVEANRIWLIPVNQHAQTADITQSGSSYKFKTKTAISTANFNSLDIGQGYVIKVTGEDMQGNDIVSNGDFCFSLTTSGVNIDITTASVNPLWISTNSAAKTQNKNPSVILKYSSENQDTSNAIHPFQVWRGLSTSTLEQIDDDIPTSMTTISGAQATTTDTTLISGLNISSSNKPATVYYKIKGTNSAETITPKPVALQYDDANPTVSIPSTDLPSTDAGEQSSITFRGTASDADSGINKVYVQIYDKDHTSETTPAAPSVGAADPAGILTATYSGGTWVLPVTPAQHDGGSGEDSAFVREGKKVVIVTVEDAVGLRATTQASAGEFIYDKTKPTGSITDTTANPVPSITSGILNLSGTAQDGWGVAKVEITQKKKNSSGVFANPITRTVWEEASSATTPSPTVNWNTANTTGLTLPFKTNSASYTQPEMDGTGHPADGEYEYTVTVTDKAGKTNTTSITKQISFYSVTPEISFTQPTGSFALTGSASTTPWQTTSNNITISGSASVNSGASITGVYYQLDPASAPTAFTSTTGWTLAGQSTWSISQTISDSATAHHLYVVAVDNAGKKSDIAHKVIKVDASAPVTTAACYKRDGGAIQTASGTVYVKNGTSLTVYGNYSDAASGVQALTFGGFTPASVQYSTSELTVSGGSVTAVPADSAYGPYSSASATAYKTWKAVLNFTASSTGGTLTATGTNCAGLTTPVTVINIQVDTSAPEVTITSPATNTFIGNADLSITGTANDGTGSGLSSVAFEVYYTKLSSLGGTTPTSITAGSNPSSAWVSLGTVASGATWSYSITQENIASLTTANANTPLWFTIAAKDKAGSGNIGYALPVKVTVDRKLPSYTEASTQIGGKTTAQLAASPWFSQSTLAVSGTYTDDGSGVDLIYYQLGSATPVPVPTNDGTFTTNISGFTEGTAGTVLKLKAKDKAGNITSESSYTVKVDTSTTTLSANCYKKGSAATLYPATGTAYLGNTTTAITVYGKYENNVSGVQALTFKYGNSTLIPTSVQYSTSDLTISDGSVTAVPADSAYGAYSAASATSYKTWKAVFTPTANGRLIVEGSNNAGVPVNATAFEVTIDTEDPALENIKLKETTGSGTNTVTKEAYIRESNSTYYVNNSTTAGKTFKVTGVATDNYGVEKVSFSVVRWANGSATSDTPLTVADITNPSGAWEKAITGWSSWTDSAKITVTATDKAGRTKTSTINIAFDTAAPKPMHWADAKNKDIYFRIGNADNDKNAAGTQWETDDTVNTENNPNNEDVGSKYSFGTWGSDSSIEIRGTFEEADTGSGIKAIYYAIFDNATTLEAKLSDFTAGTLAEDPDNHVIKVGSFAPLDTAVTKKVPYNKKADGTLKGNKVITTNFRTTLSGFNAQNNFLVLLAEDYAGNRALDELKVTEGTTTTGTGVNATVENNGTAITNGPNTWNDSKAYYGIKKDTQTPDIGTSVTEGIYTNGAGNAITISGTARDLLSGLKNVVVTIEEINFSETYSGFVAGPAIQNWSVTVPASAFASIDSGSYTAYAEATDRAGSGNKKKISAATIYVDKTPPTVTINSPVANAKVGAEFTISGTAKDGTGAGVNTAATAKPVLYYTTSSTVGVNAPTTSTIGTDASSSWKVYGNPTLANDQDWSLDVNLSAVVSANANTPVYLSVSATDKSGSGNTGYSSPRLVTVDTKAPQKSAFNIGTTAEASINTTWFNNNTLNINGSFTDDGTTGSGVAAIIYKLDSGSEQEIPSTGSFDRPVAGFTDTTSATPHTLQVRARDAVGNLSAWVPYSVKVDTARPVISAVAGHPFTETTLTNGSAARTFYFDVLDTGSGITVPAANATAAQIANIVTVEISNSSNQSTTITHGSNGSTITVGAADATTGKHLVTVVLGAADLASLSGSNSVLVSVSDTAGNQSNLQSIGTLNVDTDDPVPAFTSHNHTATVNKQITLSGTVTDASNSAITAMSLTATCGSTSKVYGYPTGTDGNITYSNGQWSYTLNTTDFNNTVNAANMTLTLTATDAAGNTGSAAPPVSTDPTTPMTLSINQNSDRPVVKFTNLVREGDGTNASPYKYILKYGNNAQLEGSITDDDSTSAAVVTTFKASSSPITSADAATTGTTSFNAATGEFTFTPADTADGLKTVYFYIKDNNNSEFYTTYSTGTTAQLGRPYQQYKTSDKEDNDAAFNYSSDSNAPTINSVLLQAYTAASGGTTSGSATTLGASCIVGGENKKYVTLSVSAKDGNGIKGIVVELEQATGASTSVIKRYRSNTTVGSGTFTASGSVTATENINQNHVYTTGRLDLATLGFTQNSNSTVDDIKEGKVTVRVYVYDNSGLYSNQESLFVIDNTAPTLNITTPAANGEQVYAIQSNTVGGSVDGHTDVETIYYAVTTTATAPTTNATGVSTAGWHEIPNAKLSASVIFDGVGVGTSSTEGYHSDALRAWIKTLNNQTDAQLNANDDRITVYVHFKVVDKCGNAGITTRNVSAYPNGDKPVIELVYPEDKAGGAIPSLAGTIRIYGYASVAIGTVTATYIQIDPSYENSGFSSSWETELATVTAGKANYTVEDIGTSGLRGIKANGTQNWNLPINGNNEFNPTGTDESRHMAIRVYSLSDSGKVSEPFLQKFDVDPNAPHIGGDGTKDALTDTTARQYSLQIVDFAGAVTAAKTITDYANPVSYKPDMWVKGQKYLIASVYDDSGIKALTLNENINGVGKINLVSFTGQGENQVVTIHDGATLNTLNGGGRITVTQSPCGYTGKRNLNIVIPLPTNSGSGSINWQLEATEDGDNNNNCISTIKLNYDNAAPKLGMTDHAKYSIDADIHQSNGFYTFKGYATDAEGDSSVSGMRGVAFYFMRRGTAATNPVTKVYDPMLENNSVAVRTGSTDADGIIYSHGLYWKQKTNVGRDTSDLKKFTLSTADTNVHAGGLALVGGSIYRIESVSGTTVMLDEDIPTSQTTVSFALALVVDNLTKKETTTGRTIQTAAGYGHGYYSALASADDGDLMQEDWDGTSIEGQWTAIINSANIPDGPIELHYVAFDKAQNYAVGIVGNVAKATYEGYETQDAVTNAAVTGATTDTTNKLATKYYYTYDSNKPAYISNNAPRIAGVTVGTDYNGDGDITDGSVVSGAATLNEKKSKYSGEADRYIGGTTTSYIQKKATGSQLEKIFLASSNETTPMMVIKDKMSVDIEIIGGNGDLYYRYKVGTGDWNNGDSAWVEGTDFTRNANEGLTGVDAFSQSYYNTTAMPTLNFSETDIKNKTSADGTVLWTFEIWDSTEERTHFVDSQNTTLKLPLDIQVRDGLRPNTVVSDLYWNSATDNSVYLDVNNKPHGHVELVQDLTGTALATTYGATDDKVSGVVVFRGFAYDNKRLSQIDWAIVNSAGNSILPNNASGITYQTGPAFTNGAWSNGGSTGDLAYNATTKTMTGTYKFTIKTAATDGAYLDEKGHKVAWELAVDTSKINGVVASNAKLYVRAKDTSGSATTQYTDMTATGSAAAGVTDQEAIDKATKKPTYQVDILPYITNVKTWLSKKNKSNPTVYSRTAKGHYPIASSETATGSVVLQGYNLASGNADVDISGIIANRTTGAYAYTVSGTITTINNMNNNNAHGDYDIAAAGLEENTKVANMYNRTPNTVTNLTLNDDVYFDMWEFKKAATVKSGKINEPVMRINPVNQSLGFAFANGADSLSLPSARTQNNTYNFTSYTNWQYNYANYAGINFVYDTAGTVHSISTGLDTEPSGGLAGYMQYINSGWGGNGNNMNNWNAERTLALESVGIPSGVYVNGTALTANLIDVDRFGKPAFAVAGTNRAYLAYYDGDNNQIRFRYGSNLTTTRRTGGRSDGYGQFSDNTAASGTIGHDTAGNVYNSHTMFEADTSNYSLLAGKTQGATQTDTGNGTSEFVALDVIAGDSAAADVVVIVWYDGSDLMYTYRYGTKDDTDCRAAGVADRWSEPQVIFEGVGQYCTIKVDKNNGIHIAGYSRSGADLYYAYMPAYNDYAHLQTALVDSYSQVGKYISLDTALVLREGSTTAYNVVPYITYYGDGYNGLPKLAYLPGGINKDAPVVPDGATDEDDMFTGSWEVSVIPTSSEVNEDNMNIALWKTAAGVLTNSTKPATGYTEPNITAAGTNTATWYGNGTSKFVLGYGITDKATGFIEIGQMKN